MVAQAIESDSLLDASDFSERVQSVWTARRARMVSATSVIGSPLSAVGRFQTYVNALYLLLSFPLGVFYFVFLVTGLSLGFGLLVVWIGVPILIMVLAGSWVLCRFEQEVTNRMLQLDIPRIVFPSSSDPLHPGTRADPQATRCPSGAA
jgi:hypothetical protein